MKSTLKGTKVTVELDSEEALVFFDWLFRFGESGLNDSFQHQSEQRVLWDLESTLEKVLSDTFSSDYKAKLEQAREKVKD